MPVTIKVVKTPVEPAGIVSPVKEKPITVSVLVETVKPFSSANPPEAPPKIIPETLNSNPAKSTEPTTTLTSIILPSQLQNEIEDVQFYGKCTDMDNSLYTVLSCHFPATDIAEMLLFNLDILGVACSGGSACASGGSKSSHVLTEILPESKRPGIRFSFSKYTTKEDIDFRIDKLKELFS